MADAVYRAWNDAGPVPAYHRKHQDALRKSWPALAKALDGMEPPMTTSDPKKRSTPEFKPTHRLRERGTEIWVDVRADGVEPQTYYDREGKTIYAGIWFRNMEVERIAPQPGDHDELLAELDRIARLTPLQFRNHMPHVVQRFFADLAADLRTEQSARQAAEEQAIPVFEEANRLEAENDDLRAEIGLMLRTRGLVEITAERDALQQRIDAALALLDQLIWNEEDLGAVAFVRAALTTESKEPNMHICFSGCRCGGQGATESKEPASKPDVVGLSDEQWARIVASKEVPHD